MTKRIGPIVFIFFCTSLAWMVLGATIFARTGDAASSSDAHVASSWGGPQLQQLPTLSWPDVASETQVMNGTPQSSPRTVQHPLPLEQTRAVVNVSLDYRQKGLLWFSTYSSDFHGLFTFRNSDPIERRVRFSLPFPSAHAVYENVDLQVNGAPVAPQTEGNAITAEVTVPAGKPVTFAAAFRSRGTEQWAFSFGDGVTHLHDFSLQVNTDFKGFDFPDDSLPPVTRKDAGNGEQLTWNYSSLVTGLKVSLAMPQHLQPGPLAGRISFFAPVSLFFFFFLIFVITTMRNIRFHPINYFFLATAFFAFHLLLAYLVDHISIHLAMLICSAVSVFLVVSYLRLVVGTGFAFREAALAQLVYLVLFSYAFFWEGYTGLSITVVAIITLFIVMQATARTDWPAHLPPTGQATPGPLSIRPT